VPKGVLISATGRPLRDSTGRPCGGVVVFRDISERKRAEEALRKAHDQLETRVRERTDALSMANAELKRQIGERERAERARQATENRYRALIEKSLDAVSLVDRDGNILYTSSSAQRVLGYSPEEFNSIAGFDLIHPEDIERARSIVLKALRRSGESLTAEIRVRHKDGTWRWIECVTTNLIDEPSVHAVVVNYRDKTDRKLAEEKLARRADELARINAELEQFAYVASHDMREPLRMIASYLQLLAQRYKGSIDDRADKYIHYAVEGAKRMQELITDLSAYTRVGTGAVSFQSVDCANCVSVAIANLKLIVEESGAQVTWGSLPVVMGEPGQLAQVFQNLIENAIKYRGEKPPQIRIIAERNGSNWLFTIADNGIGIDPRFSSRIFRIFQRLHEPDKYPGTGIGLAIVKKIVERHGGKIWVESCPGEGASFHFTIPCSVSEG
jgi:PAS domain S-box-containing protein